MSDAPKPPQPVDGSSAPVVPAPAPASIGSARPAVPPPPRAGIGATGVFLVALIAVVLALGGAYATRGLWLKGDGGNEALLEQALADAAAARQQVAELAAKLAKPGDAPADAKTAADIRALQDALKTLAKEKEALAQSLAQMGGKIDTAGGGADPAQAQRLERLESQLRALNARLADIDRKTGQLDQVLEQVQKTTERAAQYGTRMDKLDQDLAARSGQDARTLESAKAASLIALSFRLRQSVDAGQAYGAQFAALKQLAGDDAALGPALKALEPGAAAGLPTLTKLRGEFARMARLAVALDDEGGDLFSEAWRRIKQVVSVRRVGADVKGDDGEAVIARAEAALNQGNLAEALAQLRGLKGRAAQAAAPWIANATSLLAAQQACDSLLAAGAQRLARAGDKS